MKNKVIKISSLLLVSTALSFNLGNLSARGRGGIKTAKEAILTKTNLTGKPAPDFTLKNIEGTTVSLSNYKGKVVYLDIWASWCAPCLYQIKKSTPLKEHFKNNEDVVFLNVSIDKDETVWKNTVAKRNIKGVNLYSKNGEEANIVENYQIVSIPKFVLIDKNGTIVDENAKAPSDKSLKKDIEKLL